MKKIAIALLVILGLLVGLWMLLFYNIYSASRLDLAEKADAIAILGAAEYAGKPSPVFKARLDHALELYKKGQASIIITTGGTYPGEKTSEGEVGEKYLEAMGVPSSKIITDKYSLTTKQNLARIADIAHEQKLEKIIIVSDPFHMYRALRVAKDLGLNVFPSPTKTSPISENFRLEFWYIARESFLTVLHILFDA
ncbi:YdcF family protein [Candidatus Peregrinibacteria bacterium]|nr:YdcF family protein [Candidatus Peregrinibacteria bacterium]